MKKRSIILSLIFCIITFGIYGIYWFVSLTNATNKLDPKHATFGGVAALLLSYITVGIYALYWVYRMGQKAGTIVGGGSDGMLYLILGIFTFAVVPICLAQSALNKYIGAETTK